MNISDLVRAVRQGSPLIYWTALVHLAWIPVVLLLMMLDDRVLLGINAWIKPLKFLLSTSIFLITTAIFIRDLGHPPGSTTIAAIVAVAMIVENSLIILQSFRGVRSHFNNETALNAFIFGLMGTFIVINTIAMAWLFVSSLRVTPDIGAGYLWGIRLGIFVFLLGSAEAGFMIRAQAHTIGAPDGGPGIFLLNWSTRWGDLRVGHFIGLHALQFLPLAGWMIDKFGIPNPALVVSLLAIAYAGVTVLLTLQALSGKPLFF